jgi:hypothetical protein
VGLSFPCFLRTDLALRPRTGFAVADCYGPAIGPLQDYYYPPLGLFILVAPAKLCSDQGK